MLLAAAAAAYGILRLERRRALRWMEALGPRAPELAAEVDTSRLRLCTFCAAVALLAGGLASMQPAWGEGDPGADPGEADILVCLDVSRSMLARDVAPDRLRRALAEIRALADRARGDRLGLVIFAGEARLLVPLTQDAASFIQLLELAEPGGLPRGGSDLGAAVDAALRALGEARGEHEAIVLLTDGEDLAGGGLAAARRAQARGIAIHCVGFGSTRGSKIAVAGERGETFLRDGSGAEVVSALDAAGLQAIAETTGGMYLEAGAEASVMAGLHAERLGPLSGRAPGPGASLPPAHRFPLFLLVAFALGILELGTSVRKRR